VLLLVDAIACSAATSISPRVSGVSGLSRAYDGPGGRGP
jgi:hypothetical protein